MDLDNLIKIFNNRFNIDIRDKSRKLDYVIVRSLFYDAAYNKFKLGSLDMIGNSVNKNHASVLHSLKNLFPIIKTNYKDYQIKYDNIILNVSESNEDPYAIIDSLRHELYELKKSVFDDDDINSLMSSIASLPKDKFQLFELRANAILKMI